MSNACAWNTCATFHCLPRLRYLRSVSASVAWARESKTYCCLLQWWVDCLVRHGTIDKSTSSRQHCPPNNPSCSQLSLIQLDPCRRPQVNVHIDSWKFSSFREIVYFIWGRYFDKSGRKRFCGGNDLKASAWTPQFESYNRHIHWC